MILLIGLSCAKSCGGKIDVGEDAEMCIHRLVSFPDILYIRYIANCATFVSRFI